MLTSRIYAKWMAETQSRKYEGIFEKFGDELRALGGRVLDVGSGEGWFLERFRKHNSNTQACGIDIRGPSDIRGDGMFLPFRGGTFDGVVCIDSLHLLMNADELARVLKPGGLLLVSVFFNEENYHSKLAVLKKTFSRLAVVDETVVGDVEKDVVVLFRKP